MKKEFLKGTIIGFVCTVSLMTASLVFGDTIAKTIEVTQRKINLVVDFEAVNFGEEPDIFIYEGKTYVPLRTFAEIIGKNVEWDENSGSIFITSPEDKNDNNKTSDTAQNEIDEVALIKDKEIPVSTQPESKASESKTSESKTSESKTSESKPTDTKTTNTKKEKDVKTRERDPFKGTDTGIDYANDWKAELDSMFKTSNANIIEEEFLIKLENGKEIIKIIVTPFGYSVYGRGNEDDGHLKREEFEVIIEFDDDQTLESTGGGVIIPAYDRDKEPIPCAMTHYYEFIDISKINSITINGIEVYNCN